MQQVWLVSGKNGVFTEEVDPAAIPTGDLGKACAYWLSADCLASPLASTGAGGGARVFQLHHSMTASLRLDAAAGCAGGSGDPVSLILDPAGMPPELLRRFPQLAGLTCLRLPALPAACANTSMAALGADLAATVGSQQEQRAACAALLRCQLALVALEPDGRPVDATGVQTAGAIDDLCAYDGPLGAELPGCGARPGGGVTLRVWAPTAQRVRLLLWDQPQGGEPLVVDMASVAGGPGVWTATGGADWVGRYYAYEVTAFSPTTGRVETAVATDPYSRSLNCNGSRTHALCLAQPSLAPPAWASLGERKPPLAHFCDVSLYELHVRDFSISDASCEPLLRGSYLAFCSTASDGVRHLRSLAAAGLTHVHLLPCYDFGSVDEDRSTWRAPEGDLAAMPPDSGAQQAAVTAVADADGYNWGYDPVHWGVPDGSYSLQPDGGERVLEFRRMVDALNGMGLRVVVDVVYNHTFAAGPASRHSVLDKLVPGYYHRRDATGAIEASTCMNNTASEHAMCERLIVDDLLHWAKDYKVDGFRFDLMGHLMKRTILRARAELDALTLERDGVDGRTIYMYGEGWDYAEVANGRVGENAAQLRLAGTRVGSFNDRLREAAMGANPFGDPRTQGLLTGLYLNPNKQVDQGSPDKQAALLGEATERCMAAVGGNLAELLLPGVSGVPVAGRDAGWPGSNCGYAGEPCETVNYVSAHDNETLYDMVVLKAPLRTSAADKASISRLATALVALSQGVPFFHAGDELLRSKSLDRDSYNSGDWFNALDWSCTRSNFGVGLPPAAKNAGAWAFMRPLLADLASNRPSPAAIRSCADFFRALLAVRASTPLLRLRSAADVAARLRFFNAGPKALPGMLIWMVRDGNGAVGGALDQAPGRFQTIEDPELPVLDASHSCLLVAVNATGADVSYGEEALVAALQGSELVMHPALAGLASRGEESFSAARAGWDGERLRVPRLTAFVLVAPRHRAGIAPPPPSSPSAAA